MGIITQGYVTRHNHMRSLEGNAIYSNKTAFSAFEVSSIFRRVASTDIVSFGDLLMWLSPLRETGNIFVRRMAKHGEENQGNRRVLQISTNFPLAGGCSAEGLDASRLFFKQQPGTMNTQNTARDQMVMGDKGLALQMMRGG